MKKLTALITLLLCIVAFAKAQNPADLAKTEAVQETQEVQNEIKEFPEDVLTNYMMTALSKKGKSLGTINSDGTIYVIAANATARPSNMPGFINSRNIAYSIAELTAKMNLLRLAGEQITSGRGFTMLEDIIEGEDPDASHKAGMLEKAAKIVDKSLDKALEYLGVSEEDIAKMNQSKKQAVYEQNFDQTVKSLVAGMVKGCAVVKMVEGEIGSDDYQIAICMKYSPEFQSLAAVIRDHTEYQIPVAKAKSSNEMMMNMSPEDLVSRMGVWVTYNKEGQMVVYGFGQQEVRTTSSRQSSAFSRAYSQARLQAVNNIKNFVAEDLVAEETQTNVEKLREYADGTNNYFSQQKWEQAVKAKETSLNIATEQIRQWKGKHPVSGHDVAGFVVAWTPANAETAKQLQEQFKDAPRNDANKNNSEASPERQKTKKSEYIISGEEEEEL